MLQYKYTTIYTLFIILFIRTIKYNTITPINKTNQLVLRIELFLHTKTSHTYYLHTYQHYIQVWETTKKNKNYWLSKILTLQFKHNIWVYENNNSSTNNRNQHLQKITHLLNYNNKVDTRTQRGKAKIYLSTSTLKIRKTCPSY